MMPVIEATAPRTTEYIKGGRPATSTAATETLPSLPTISWSIMANDDCSMDCRATGIAICITDLKNLFFCLVSFIKNPPLSDCDYLTENRGFSMG